jgi:hypothetical protein
MRICKEVNSRNIRLRFFRLLHSRFFHSIRVTRAVDVLALRTTQTVDQNDRQHRWNEIAEGIQDECREGILFVNKDQRIKYVHDKESHPQTHLQVRRRFLYLLEKVGYDETQCQVTPLPVIAAMTTSGIKGNKEVGHRKQEETYPCNHSGHT